MAGVSMASAGWHTALYSGTAAALATVMALPVALLAVRHKGRTGRFLERSSYLVLAMPGVVIALALSYFAEHYLDGFGYQSAPLLVVAYSILFFPLALVGVRASVAYAPVALEEIARSLGQRPWAVLARVTLPSSVPGSPPRSAWFSWPPSPSSRPPWSWCPQASKPSPLSFGHTSKTSPMGRRRPSPW